MGESTGGEIEQRRKREEAAGLWPIGRALTVAGVAALAGLAVVTVVALAVLGFPHLATDKALSVGNLLDVLKLVLGTVAGVGALAALVMNYRKQRLAEIAEIRDRERATDDRVRVFNERFATAAGQLGDSQSAVRLAGVYALAGLADDWQHQRKVCIEILCAYMRMPYEPGAASAGEKEVRHSILQVIRDHLRSDAPVSWQGFTYDFTGAVFDGGDLSGIMLTSGNMFFSNAHFASGVFTFKDAMLSDGYLYFGDITVSDGTLLFFGGTSLLENANGWISFPRAQLEGGQLIFSNAILDGGILGFEEAYFSGSEIEFYECLFSGGILDFHGARFSGGSVTFEECMFDGTGASFRDAKFIGGVVDMSKVSSFARPPKFDSDPLPDTVRLPDRGTTRESL